MYRERPWLLRHVQLRQTETQTDRLADTIQTDDVIATDALEHHIKASPQQLETHTTQMEIPVIISFRIYRQQYYTQQGNGQVDLLFVRRTHRHQHNSGLRRFHSLRLEVKPLESEPVSVETIILNYFIVCLSHYFHVVPV